MQPLRLATVAFLLLLTATASAQTKVKGVRMWPAPDSTRLVLDVSGPVEHSLFSLKDPNRLVIDLANTALSQPIRGLNYDKSLLTGIRTAARNGSDLRVVLDLKKAVRPKSFSLRPNEQYGHRLVIDLEDVASSEQVVKKVEAPAQTFRDIVIAIDAGHGGEDPGASGPHRTKEKDVVLAIAHKLRDLVAQEYGMRPVMIRDGDYFVSLGKRVDIARAQRADLLVSIHADAFHDRRARGTSVYTLSPSGASSEQARLLAEKENASDLIGGVSLDDKDDLLASVLLDLSQTATIEASTEAAIRVLGELKHVNHLHKRRVEQAGFRVLKSPDLPSLLVETAFISNPTEEHKLRDPGHQYAMAKAILSGLRSYFRDNAPPGTLLAKANPQHTIARGETLTSIAQRYRVSLDKLRRVNNLSSPLLRVGDTLEIPVASGS